MGEGIVVNHISDVSHLWSSLAPVPIHGELRMPITFSSVPSNLKNNNRIRSPVGGVRILLIIITPPYPNQRGLTVIDPIRIYQMSQELIYIREADEA